MTTGQAISRGWDDPACPYCGYPAQLVDAVAIFPANPQMHTKGQRYWRCLPCKAWCRAATGDGRPVGTIADPLLRSLRDTVNVMLNSLAELKVKKSGTPHSMAKAAATSWLGTQVQVKGIPQTSALKWLTPWADVDECRAAIALMEKWVKRPV